MTRKLLSLFLGVCLIFVSLAYAVNVPKDFYPLPERLPWSFVPWKAPDGNEYFILAQEHLNNAIAEGDAILLFITKAEDVLLGKFDKSCQRPKLTPVEAWWLFHPDMGDLVLCFKPDEASITENNANLLWKYAEELRQTLYKYFHGA